MNRHQRSARPPMALGAAVAAASIALIAGTAWAGQTPSASPATGTVAVRQPRLFRELEWPGSPVHTFINYHNATGVGRSIRANAAVLVSCRVYDATVKSSYPDGFWYRIASPPWNNHYYATANTFLNGDPPLGPYRQFTDFKVPLCRKS